MNDAVLAAYPPEVQATSRAPVLMPALLPEPFDYAVPEGLPVGTLVEAPLQGRKLIGAVWGETSDNHDALLRVGSHPEPERVSAAKGENLPSKKTFKIKAVTRVLDHIPPLSKPYRAWLTWISEFTLAPKGAVLSLCGLAFAAKQPKKPLRPQQFSVTLPTLTDVQQKIAEQLHGTKPILLDGVTGSGKTEVYFHAIAAAIDAQKQVLVLLPEIALTHQWLARFEKTFGAKPVVWHSRMTPVAKARAWQAVARGEAQVVVGARSSLFLPFKTLSLIVVDEEHDPSYKQEDGVLYHARDMAVVRAQFEQATIVLASATPSLETLENVREGKYLALHLPERFGAAGLPEVTLVDMRNDPPERGDFLSPTVKKEMLATLARGEQVLLFLNRRGYAPLLLCRTCGHRFQCENCSAWLVMHKNRTLQCHHCDHREPMPKACPACNADAAMLAPCGPGVERIAEEVRAMFSIPSPLRGEEGWGPGKGKTYPLEATLTHAKELRGEMTEAEKKLWNLLRRESLGFKFRKQHPVGRYIADFACLAPKVIVELDGGQHAEAMASQEDTVRTQFLQEQGYTVLRFWNNEALQQPEAVVEKIKTTLESQTRPHPNPPPKGEGMGPSLAVLSSDETIAAETWEQIEQGRIDILVGTQMVAKGHHFPRLTFVAVVDADVGLSGADLRAGERTYQLLHQLGGRAGRGDLAGRVYIQTYLPDHPVMEALVAQNRDQLMKLEAKERRAGGWPPFGKLAAILLDGKDEAAVKRAGQLLARSAPDDKRLIVLGPAPAPLSKLRGQYRYRLLVKAKDGIHLQRTLKGWLDGQKFPGVRIKVDVNPYYFL